MQFCFSFRVHSKELGLEHDFFKKIFFLNQLLSIFPKLYQIYNFFHKIFKFCLKVVAFFHFYSSSWVIFGKFPLKTLPSFCYLVIIFKNFQFVANNWNLPNNCWIFFDFARSLEKFRRQPQGFESNAGSNGGSGVF